MRKCSVITKILNKVLFLYVCLNVWCSLPFGFWEPKQQTTSRRRNEVVMPVNACWANIYNPEYIWCRVNVWSTSHDIDPMSVQGHVPKGNQNRMVYITWYINLSCKRFNNVYVLKPSQSGEVASWNGLVAPLCVYCIMRLRHDKWNYAL